MKQNDSIIKRLSDASDMMDFPFGHDALSEIVSQDMEADELMEEDLELLSAAGANFSALLEKLTGQNGK